MEAVIHYTHAIKLDKKQYQLFSNRSLAFLKLEQYFYALDDAQTTIKLNPNWPKGYFRRGEVYFATGNYREALDAYREALELEPDDNTIKEAMKKSTQMLRNKMKEDMQAPWMGGAFGLVLGLSIVIADQVFPETPSLKHPMLQAIVTMVICIIAYAIVRSVRYYGNIQRSSLLQPPIDLLGDSTSTSWDEYANGNAGGLLEEEEEPKQEKPQRINKAAARHKMKKNKR